jgi:type II secretory pathway pseudopilin PulG
MRCGREDGFTFNELLMAMGLVGFIVVSSSVGSLNLIRRQIVSDNATVAINLARDKMEELQARRPLLDDNVCPAGGDHGLSSKSGVAGVFDRCWRIAPSTLQSDLKQIDVIVSWRDHEAHETRLATLVYSGE